MIKNMSITSIHRGCGFVLLIKFSKRLEEIERKLENKVELGDVVALINEKSEKDKKQIMIKKR